MRDIRIAIAIAAVAELTGCGSPVSGDRGATPGNNASVTMSGSPATPGSPETSGEVTVTEPDNGRTIHLHIGQRLQVVLGSRGEQWHLPASHEPSLRLAAASGGYPSGRPATAVYLAVQPGTASVTSMTDHPCLHSQPPCKIAQRVWSVRVVVKSST